MALMRGVVRGVASTGCSHRGVWFVKCGSGSFIGRIGLRGVAGLLGWCFWCRSLLSGPLLGVRLGIDVVLAVFVG